MGEHRSGWGRVVRRSLKVIGYLLAFLLVLLISVSLLLQSQWGQDILKDQAARYLERRLKTRVAIGGIRIKWLSEVEIRDVVMEDRQQRKLLELGLLHARLKTLDLVSGQLNLSEVKISDLSIRLFRKADDSTFNFQFIPDAFASKDDAPAPATKDTSAGFSYRIGTVDLSRVAFLMQDGWSGTDVDLRFRHLALNPRLVDPGTMRFRLGKVTLDSASLAMNSSPVFRNEQPSTSTTAMPWLDADELSLSGIDLRYNDLRPDTALALHTAIGALRINHVTADLPKNHVKADSILLADHATTLRSRPVPVVPGTGRADTTASAPYTFSVGSLQLAGNAFAYRDESGPAGGKAFNAKDLGLKDLNLQADSISYDGKRYLAAIRSLTARERSGFEVKELRAKALYADTAVSLTALLLRTGRNTIDGDMSLSYASLDALAKKPGKAAVDINLKKGVFRLDEMLVFSPDLARNKNIAPLLGREFIVSTRMKGTVADLDIPSLVLTESGNRVAVSGRLRNLPDMERLAMDLRMQEIRSTRKDLLALLPKDMIADSLKHYIPERFTLRGTTKGTMDDITAHLSLASTLGDLRVDGNLRHPSDPKTAQYDLRLDLVRFKLGELLQDTTMGELTATVTGKGQGYDPYTAHAAFSAAVKDFLYRGYGYHDIGLNGSIEAGQLRARAESTDPNLDLDTDLAYNLTKGKGSFSTNTVIRNVDLMKLGFLGDTLSISGNIRADLPTIDSANLRGDVLLESLFIDAGERRLFLDSVTVHAEHPADTQYLSLRSKLMTMDVKGQFNFNHIPEAARIIANRYLYTQSDDTLYRHRVVATLEAQVNLPDSVARLIPGLTKVAPFGAAASINTDSSKLGLNILMPRIEYNGMVIDTSMVVGLNYTRDTRFNKLILVAGTQGLYTSSVHIPKTFLYGTVTHGVYDAKISQFNEDMKTTRYNLPFQFTNDPLRPQLHIQDSLQINGRMWAVNPDNMLYFGGAAGMRDSKLSITRNNEEIRFVTSSGSTDGLPMAVQFRDFQLENITSIIQSDTSFLTGRANGKVELESFSPATVLADLRLDSLVLMGVPVGDLKALVNHTDPDHIAVNVGLTGHKNDVSLTGVVDLKESRPDLRLDMKALDLGMAGPFAKDYVADTRGRLSGDIELRGSFKQPDIQGQLRFDSAASTLKMLNLDLRANDARLVVTSDDVKLENFILTDSAGNTARLEGGIRQNSALEFIADLKLVAKNFRIIGPRRFPEQIAYGPARADANITVQGPLAALRLEGNAKLRDSSLVTYVYTPDITTGKGDGLIEFFDPLHPPDSSLVIAARKKPAPQTAMNLFLTVTPSSTVSVVLDEMAGDALVVKGSTNLNLNKRPGEMINMTGAYTVEEGTYELTIAGLVRKKFKIERNSTITWSGEVTKANMDIKAAYETRTTAGGLVNDIQSVPGIDKQKLGFKVYLLLTKAILKPEINFELDMDENDKAAFNGIVYGRIKQVNNIPSELNKQVMGLLAINSFIADNPFSSLSGGSGFGAQAFNTVGGLLTKELNNLVGNIIKGVDISFALDMKEDYTSGSAVRNTDLKMGVRKSFANNRLAVYVGSSLALENQNQNANALEGLAGDVTLEYMLTPDGRYRLKGYRINEQVMTFQGTIIKTGVTFVVQIEFGKFKNMFRQNRAQ